MIRALMTGVIVLAAGGVLASPPRANEAQALDASEFVYRAVLAGLAADGVSPALAASLAKRADFVGKCGICGPTQKALRTHGELVNVPAPKEGKGLPADLAKDLQSEDDATRRSALRGVVQRYTEQALAKLDVSPEHRAALKQKLEEMRKDAMAGLRQGQKFCPSCDGATCRTPKL